MASYNELNALIDAYINRNGVQAITGQILNGVLKAMVEQLGRGYTIMGAAIPTTDPGTPDGPECYFASETGTYTDFDGLQVAPGELALLCYTPSDGWTKATIYEGFQEVGATIDGNVGTPSVGVSYANGVLSFDFHNMKGNPGEDGNDGAPAGFGTVNATVDGNVGTPGVSVQTSGPDTAKNFTFAFHNLKGETGVTSVVATVDNTSGNPQCAVSLVGQQLTLAFTGIKGAQGNSGYQGAAGELQVVNNLTDGGATAALSAEMGKELDGKVSQLEAKVDEKIDGVEQNAVAGKYINSSGAEATDANAAIIGFLPYSSGDVVWKYGTRNANYAICFYDSDKQLLGAWTTISSNAIKERTITASEIETSAPGAAFLKASIRIADGEGVEIGGVLIPPVYQTVVGIEPRVSDLEDDVTALGERIDGNDEDIENLQAKDVEVESKVTDLSQKQVAQDYIEITDFPVDGNIKSDGTLDDTTLLPPSYKCTDFLPINDKCIIHWKGREVATPMAAFYSADNESSFISYFYAGNAWQDEVLSVPEGAKFARINRPYGYVSGRDYVGIKSGIPEALDTIDGKILTLQGNVSDLQGADTALGGRIDGNDADIADLKAKDEELEGRLENIEGPYISPDNGVGGVTSSEKITQGGALVSVPFDFSRPFVYEAVLKPQNGSSVAFLNLLERYGTQNRTVSFRIHNGAFQFSCFFGSTSQYPITQSFQNSLGLVFGQWYHLCVVYDGTAVYLFANGVQRYKNEIVITQSDANGTNGCESDSLHSPKLLRLCHITIPEGKTAQDVALAHYNGGNPFGYDSSNDELYIEILPANMLKTSIKNTANDVTVTYPTEKTFDIQTENPWAAVIEGAGVPAILPVYKWQKYKDTTTGKVYTAKGTETVNDWIYEATSEDLLALRTQTKTVGGQSIWGTGDIPSGGGSGAGTFVSVADFGAAGDGVTDDTTALQNALEYARANNRALYFPNGTFLTRKGFVLTSGMRVTGEPDAIVQNAAATIEGGGKCPYTTTTADSAQGDHSVIVTDASKFRVGDEIVIWKSGSYSETMADITAINGNTITFDTSRFTADGTDGGLLNAVASAGYVLTDFAMFKTIMTKAAVNVVVENITIKPMSDMNEPHIYTSSPISQTKQGGAQPQSNFRVYNVTCYDSANDGISLQGTGDSEVIGCRVFGQKHKGIHFGTSHDKIRIEGNFLYECGSQQYDAPGDYYGSGAIFFCVNNHRVIIVNNQIDKCYRGVYGFNRIDNGSQDTDTIISGNIFKNCGLYGVLMQGGYGAVITNNIFTDFNNSAIPVHTEAEGSFKFTAGIIANNLLRNFGSAFAGPAIQVTGARNLVLAGNNVSGYVNNDASTVRSHCDITVATSEKVAITNNVVDGVIDISDSGNTGIVKDNNIETS